MGNSLSRPDDPYSRTRRSWDIPRNTKDRITKTASSKVKETKRTAWATLETTLHLLERSTDAFPLLKSAVADLIGCLDIIQAAAANVEAYEELTSQFMTMAETLSQYMKEVDSEGEANNGSIALMSKSINAQVSRIATKRGRSKGKRLFESQQDKDDVIRCYHEIDKLFRQLQNDLSLRTFQTTKKHLVLSLLQGLSAVEDAKYDSAFSTKIKRRGCTPETREKVQEELQEWVQDSSSAKVFWMSGMAGTGKTTLAYSLCEWLEKNNQLGASFFCSRTSSSCRDLNRIVPSIAHQLARYSPPFRSELCKVLDGEPEVGKKNIVKQFEKLLQAPLSEVRAAIPEGVVVVIDALDECEDTHGVRLMLEMLLKFATNLPLKFFVASRPEPTIRNKMISSIGIPRSIMHLHEIEQSIVKEDIKKYLTEALSPMIPPPEHSQIDQLARNAGKLFIYAATTVRYIYPDDDTAADSNARLRTMVAMNFERPSREGPSLQYAELDRLYSIVLASALNHKRLEDTELENMRRVLWTVVCAREPMSVRTLGLLLDLTDQQVSSALQPLRSVLHVSEGSDAVSTLHASFPDYMFDRSRSDRFHCDEHQHSEFLARCCFEVMKEKLRFNICNLESSFTLDEHVPRLDERVEEAISPILFYACRYWSEHLRRTPASRGLSNMLTEFLTQRLLFWMEVLNLRKCITHGATILLQAQNWLSENGELGDRQKQVGDVRNFVTGFAAHACSQSTPHIYISALPLCPKSSLVYRSYLERTQGLMNVKGSIIEKREQAALAIWKGDDEVNQCAFSPNGDRIVSAEGQSVWVRDAHAGIIVAGPFEGHTDSVRSVAFSPDGTRIVSGSDDLTIRVWDSQTSSATAGPFQGHTDSVRSVAFSPDGTRVVSGSRDCTIRVWDLQTGSGIASPFQGHTFSVMSVSFSPDGTRIVSGSGDCTIRVWDSRTGSTVAGSFVGHTSSVMSVSFSPDGTRIVSGSYDRTIRVWNSQTGSAVADTIEGHKSSVTSATFSPDGTCLVSGSDDGTIRVWDSQTSSAIAGPFEGHTGSVTSVAFSPDGTRIVSGSKDHTIRVWDSRTSPAIVSSSEGHTDSVTSVSFSPDGSRIVSGSYDDTIRVWDSQTGSAVARPFHDYAALVVSVAFSPGGTRIASSSRDCTIRVWDSQTGCAFASSFRGHTNLVRSVVFSPDGTRIVSGSYDRTLRVWDSQTGFIVAGPLEGHTDSVTSVAFSPNGTSIVSGSDDSTIRVWDSQTGSAIADPFQGHTNSVTSVAFSPDGTRIVSGSGDHTIRVWDLQTGSIAAGPFEGHTDLVTSVAFSPNGTSIVSGSGDRTIRAWDSQTGSAIASPFQGHTSSVTSVAFSPDGTRIVSGSYDRTIRVWDSRIIASRFVAGTESAHLLVSTPGHTQVESTQFTVDTTHWVLNKDGWVVTNDNILFWVPPDLHDSFPLQPNLLRVSPPGSLSVECWDLLFGDRWPHCFVL